MLDFYSIKDDQTKPSSPEQLDLKFVGGLEEEAFENLRNKKIIDSRFNYYTDFRWSATMVKQLHETIKKKQIQSDTDVHQLIKLLNIADNNKCGLVAYAD
jgi:hypothetical protein